MLAAPFVSPRREYFGFATCDLWRAALLRWMSPLPRRPVEEAGGRPSSQQEDVAAADLALLSAVRSDARCARLRTAAARDLRMFFFADAIFGTK